MRMTFRNAGGVAHAAPHPHKKTHRLEAFERWTDVLTVALVAGLGAAMVIGLLTSTGSVYW
jgi:hypothetical protein